MKLMPHEMPASMRAPTPKRKEKPTKPHKKLPAACHPSAHEDEIRYLVAERSWTPGMIARHFGMNRTSVATWVSRRGYKRPVSNKIVSKFVDWREIWRQRQNGKALSAIACGMGLHFSSVKAAVYAMSEMTDAHRERVLQFRDDWKEVMHG